MATLEIKDDATVLHCYQGYEQHFLDVVSANRHMRVIPDEGFLSDQVALINLKGLEARQPRRIMQ